MQPYPYLDQLLYCLESGFPAPIIEAMLALAADNSRLAETHNVWEEWADCYIFDFSEVVEEVTGSDCSVCDDCCVCVWETWDTVDGQVCQSCSSEYYTCDSCESRLKEATSVGDSWYCDRCLSNYCVWCAECEAYVHRDDEDHGHPCDCEAPRRKFEFPNDGHGTASQDERIVVQLPKGTIDERGITHITNLVQREIAESCTSPYFFVYEYMEELGVLWQTKQGNFTRRLSSLLYRKHKYKLSPEVISEVGNIARAHSSNDAEWNIEFTRDFNLSAAAFYHEESCWFTEGSYGRSRCCLKQWGGIGLRTFGEYDEVSGRAWVQPLDADLQPTHDAVHAHAYIVYNGYGDLEGYTPARIVAHLTGRTYKKVGFEVGGQFVNNSSGYLIADESTCLSTSLVTYTYDIHHRMDADEIRVEVSA